MMTAKKKPAAKKASAKVESMMDVPDLAAELQRVQRFRAIILKSRNMMSNRLQAIVAGYLGYQPNMPEKDRRKLFKEATVVIQKVVKEGEKSTHPYHRVIIPTMAGIDAFNMTKEGFEKDMLKAAKQLPVAEWVKNPEQRGFGLLFLGIVIGETGDLSKYPNPGKVWRRLGCAPWSFDGKTLMGATWRSGREGKLPALEWENYGYSPRRRSIAYLIGEGLVKQNFMTGGSKIETETMNAGCESDGADGPNVVTDEDYVRSNGGNRTGDVLGETDGNAAGPYRLRYLYSKKRLKEVHPDYSDKRCHLHGMLLATKLLLKKLWIEWNRPAKPVM